MAYSRHYRPALKNSVDVQLQTAFSDGNWQSVIRLADKRAKSLKDPYYEVGALLLPYNVIALWLTVWWVCPDCQDLCSFSARLAGR